MNMLTIIRRTIRDRKFSLIAYLLAAVLFLWMYVALFPTMQEQSEVLATAFESFPDAFFKAFGIEDLNISSIDSFLAMEHFSIVWPLMAIMLLVSIAGRGLSGQIEQGTIEIILSCPVSRLCVLAAKYLAGMITLFVFTIASIFTIAPFAAIHGVDYVFGNFATVSIISFLFGWAVFSVAVLFSTIFSERGRVYMATGGMLLIMYILNIAAALNKNLDGLKFASFFHYYNYNDAIVRNTLHSTDLLVFVAVAIMSTLASAWIFHKRDICV
jgi:ABC-2 type transport system permease protein